MKLQAVKLIGITAFCIFINQVTLPANAKSTEENHLHKGHIPEEYRQLEFLAALSIASICVFLGTGKSMKLVKKPIKKSLKQKNSKK